MAFFKILRKYCAIGQFLVEYNFLYILLKMLGEICQSKFFMHVLDEAIVKETTSPISC